MTPGPDGSTAQWLLHGARTRPDAPAVMIGAATTSYQDMVLGVARLLKALRLSSVAPGMLVAIVSEDRPLHLRLLLACEALGVTVISLPRTILGTADPILDRCDMLCLGPDEPAVEHGGGQLRLDRDRLAAIDALPLADSDLAALDQRPDDQAITSLVRTSGSTGRPKVIAMRFADSQTLIARTTWQPDDPGHAWNFLNLYNFTNRSSWQESAIALRQGRTVVLSSMARVFQDMDRFPSFRMTLVSGDAARLAEAVPAGWGAPRAALIHVKGGALTPVVRAGLRRIVTHVYQNYGANEVSRVSILDDQGVGTLLPDVVARVMTAEGAPAPHGQPGLIEVRAPGMATGYLWDDAASRAAFRDGWYRTGDIGVMPDARTLVVWGRADDWVNLGGIKFAPAVQEQRIAALAGVRDAALLAIPDPQGLDRLHVVLEADDPAVVDRHRDALVEILSGTVDVFIPHVLPAFPRTETGKTRRHALRRLLAPPACPSRRPDGSLIGES